MLNRKNIRLLNDTKINNITVANDITINNNLNIPSTSGSFVSLGDLYSNAVFCRSGSGLPTFNTRSSGHKVIIGGGVTSNSVPASLLNYNGNMLHSIYDLGNLRNISYYSNNSFPILTFFGIQTVGARCSAANFSLTNITSGNLVSNTKLVIPKYSTTARDLLSPVSGEIIFNTTTNLFNFWNGSAWEVCS